ncbi:MAG TPA: thiamine pyrophosphate-binding protein, partial [Alphaproteobacteria bacterium]|nr:thiamine pyrophosphate-binding protein [Alphaproteobacteria bacterium]
MEKVERPVISETTGLWGSDLIAEMLRALDVEYVALNPGSSFRGLHDSLVNHLGNENPQMLLCLHEEHTVAIAHGWAKVTGRPMAAIVHANVGLMHATMSIYNAWCDRVPVMVFGATGPVDATERRPWIDWIHTSRDQAAIVRPYVKWDDQPASLSASLEAMIRGALIAKTAPMAPVYICFDVVVQEEAVTAPIKTPDPRRFKLPMSQGLLPDALAELHTRLKESRSPVFLMGRVSRSADDWAYRVALAEHSNARVLTDIKLGAA